MRPVGIGENIFSAVYMIGHCLQRNHFRKIYNIGAWTNIYGI